MARRRPRIPCATDAAARPATKKEPSTKKKAGQALLKAHRSGELEAIADDMERKLNQLNPMFILTPS